MGTTGGTRQDGRVWCIILAAGEGTRLRELGTGPERLDRPKQYCVADGGSTLLRQAVNRAAMLTTTDRVVPVVAASHQRWWEAELASLSSCNVIVQPSDRGTACGLLLPLVHVLFRDPQAVVIVLPSDHVVEDEAILARTARQGVEAARREPGSSILLGMQPDAPHSDLGWITPSQTSSHGMRAVLSFVEKPPRDVAQQLMEAGALINSLIIVARGLTLLAMYERAVPGIVDRFAAAVVGLLSKAGRHARVERLYEGLPTLDLSRDLLQQHAADLRVVPVPPCGWSDIGTPERLVRWTQRRRSLLPRIPARLGPTAPPDLAGLARAHLSRGRPPSAAHSL